MKANKLPLGALSVLVGGCLLTGGCGMQNASGLAGYSNPTLKMKKGIFGSMYFEAGTNFTGDVEAKYNPETGQFELSGTVGSDASGVVGAEGERADHLVELRRIEADYLIRSQEIVGENFQAFGNMLAVAAAGGGDAVSKVIDATVPILAGSGGTIDLGKLGGASLNLGTTPAPTTPDPKAPDDSTPPD